MDINLIREAVTVVALLTFLGIAFWAWKPGNKSRFEQDGRIPFDGNE